MPDFALPYVTVLHACVTLAALFLVQILVADVASIRARHVPGTPVAGGHDAFLFRASRAHANTNENLPLFLLLTITAVAAGAAPVWTGRLVWVFVLSRLGHMAAYYADLRTARSASFVVGLAALVGLLALTLAALA